MKRGLFFFLLSLLCAAQMLWAEPLTVGNISAQTTRMKPQTLLRLFPLKKGDVFTQQEYDKAQDDLHKRRVFKQLSFTQTQQDNTVDIFIRAQDGYYIFPMAFITGGDKNAAGASVAAGNLFKQGETSFLFAGGSKDGTTTRAGLQIEKHFFTAAYTHLHFDQRFYRDGWYNVYDVFATADDEKHHTDTLLDSLHGYTDKISLLYSYRLTRTFNLFVRPEYKRISYEQHQLDSGNHSQLSVGINWSDDVRSGMNMGALAGYGLSDKQKILRDLPRVRFGHTAALSYTGGGKWSGSDFNLSKTAAEIALLTELKTRHLWIVGLKAQHEKEGSFSDEIISTDVLGGFGRYDRVRRGKTAAGAGTSFVYYLLRNQTGLLSVAPFYEIAYVKGERYLPHSGAGVNLFYKLWRFPLPFGINYTHNLQDGSHQIGFAIGGAF